MKNSIVNSQKEEADKMMEAFREEHKDMLRDREVIKDYVNFTIQPKKKVPEFELIKNPYDLMKMVTCSLAIFFHLFFRVQWLSFIIVSLQLLMFLLIHLVKIDYDFLDERLLWRLKTFFRNSNRSYALVYILILLSCRLSFLEKYFLFVIQDAYQIVVSGLEYWKLISRDKTEALKYFGILVDYFYIFVLVCYIPFSGESVGLKYAFRLLGFIVFRGKVDRLVLITK